LYGLQQRFSRHVHKFLGDEQAPPHPPPTGARIQLTRSCCKWSLGVRTEHSIANAYMAAIRDAKHFIYIENQFFITATSDKQKPVKNKIGRAIVDRIVRAHHAREPFQVFVVMPAVPAFAGDLRSEGAIGTRAIMEFQYASICRGGSSILETLRQSGVSDPHQYINFYNLRNYDRINTGAAMAEAERQSGVRYEDAYLAFDRRFSRECGALSPVESQYRRYQEAACHLSDKTWDSVAACYMHNGPDLRSVPWTGDSEAEIDAFVTEQLYIHSKVLIADDRVVICGSANLNDRSQVGDHDSEIAVVIEEDPSVSSTMAGRPYRVSAFASSLRRVLFRRHLGLLAHERPDVPNSNWMPVTHSPNEYDWGSPADRLVADPISRQFLDLWRSTARRNTEIFSRAFHPVPNDQVRTWEDYDKFFSKHFVIPGEKEEQAAEGYKQGKVDYGHVVRSEFPGGVAELKEWLSGVRGNLVEMPLNFLVDVPDLAEDGIALNSLTDELYT
jgi:phospholipase D1/2